MKFLIFFLSSSILAFAAYSIQYQAIGGCTTIVLEGGLHQFDPAFPGEVCEGINEVVIKRDYTTEGTIKSYQCGTLAQACNFTVEIPDEKQTLRRNK